MQISARRQTVDSWLATVNTTHAESNVNAAVMAMFKMMEFVQVSC